MSPLTMIGAKCLFSFAFTAAEERLALLSSKRQFNNRPQQTLEPPVPGSKYLLPRLCSFNKAA